MTKTETTNYTTPGNHNLHIPSKEYFSRFASNRLTNTDFCTDCAGNAVEKTETAIRWTYSNEKKRGMKFLYKGWN